VSVVVVGFSRFGAGAKRRSDAADGPRLPQGAEAALWSILEPVPDPRNHLALTRDLSGEVHVTDLERALALAARPEPAIGTMVHGEQAEEVEEVEVSSRAPVDDGAATAIDVEADTAVDVREMVDPYYDLGTIAENPHLTDHLFTTAEG
jgi:hypothetical protein